MQVACQEALFALRCIYRLGRQALGLQRREDLLLVLHQDMEAPVLVGIGQLDGLGQEGAVDGIEFLLVRDDRVHLQIQLFGVEQPELVGEAVAAVYLDLVVLPLVGQKADGATTEVDHFPFAGAVEHQVGSAVLDVEVRQAEAFVVHDDDIGVLLAHLLEETVEVVLDAIGVYKEQHAGLFGLMERHFLVHAERLGLQVKELNAEARKLQGLHHIGAYVGRQKHLAGDIV